MTYGIKSRRIVTPEAVRPGVVLFSGERILGVAEDVEIPAGAVIEDVGEAVVMPGLVDPHVHVNEPGRADWEGFETATKAAAAGGITLLIDMPLNSEPVTTTEAALAAKRAAAKGKCRVDVGFHGGVVPGNAKAVGALLGAGVAGMKAFLVPSGLDAFPAVGEADLRAVMPVIAKKKTLLVHAEYARADAPPPADTTRYADYLMSRPPVWEEDAIALMIRLCRETGCAVHIVHLATATAVPALAAARDEGLPVSVETCPHYLYFEAESIPDGDPRHKCAPPIREAAHREGLWQALEAGNIDFIASDHSPCPPAMKCLDTGDLTAAWGGIASLQFTLPVVWTEARRRGYGLRDLARWLCHAPAAFLGLERGRIAPGAPADLVVWEPEASFIVRPDAIHFRHPVTPYEGHRLFGVVRQTLVRGHRVFDRGTFPGEPVGREPAFG